MSSDSVKFANDSAHFPKNGEIDAQGAGSLGGKKVTVSKAKILFIALLIIGGAGVAVASGFGIAQLGHHMHWWTLPHPLSLRDLILVGAGGGLGALLMAGGGIGLYRHGKKDEVEDTEGATLWRTEKLVAKQASLQNNFKVKKVSPDQFQEIAKEALKWWRAAISKLEAAKVNRDPGTYAILQESCNVLHDMLNELNNAHNTDLEQWGSVLVCFDEEDKMQAIALYAEGKKKGENNRLVSIATNPDNLRHACNDEIPHRVEGAGTLVMLELIKLSFEDGKDIELGAKKEGEEFFNKLGFEGLEERKKKGGAITMKLTADEMMKRMNDGTPPFNQLTQ
jgi:hypothetical protein